MNDDLPLSRVRNLGALSPVLALLTSLALLAGCGGSGMDGRDAAAISSSPAPVEAPPAADSPAGGEIPVPTSATACLNSRLYSGNGTVLASTYRIVAAGQTDQLTQTWSVRGAVDFNGQSTTRVDLLETTSADGRSGHRFEGSLYLGLADNRVDVAGMTSRFESGGTTVQQTIVSMPVRPDLDFGASAGQSRSWAAVDRISFTSKTATSVVDATTSVTFDGFETVTVPAGTFVHACRFTVTLTGSPATQATRWMARDSGVVVRSLTSDDVQELVSATIDGQQVSP